MDLPDNISNYREQSIQILRLLQDELKRQYLLLQRQQRQNYKIKSQIDSTIKEYYNVLIEKRGLGKLITDYKLNNSQTFVKNLVLSLSQDVRAGFEVLMLCDLQTAKRLCPLLLGIFYDNFSENDPYLKKNTFFAQLLAKRICQILLQQNFMRKGDQVNLNIDLLPPVLTSILKQFCKLQSLKQYFEMLANRVFNKIPNSLRKASLAQRNSVTSPQLQAATITMIELNQSQSISLNKSHFNSISQHEIELKIQQAVQQYKTDILNKSEMMPVTLRVFCYTIVNQLSSTKNIKAETINKFIWQILQNQYYSPFNTSKSHKWNHFKNSYFSQTVHRIGQMMSNKADCKFLEKLVERLIAINKDKMKKKNQQAKKKIMIHGGCVSYTNLYDLLKIIKKNQKNVNNFNEKITNRVNRILQINPLDFFEKVEQAQKSFLFFTEINYIQTLQKDYYLSMYNKTYINNKIKDMIKLILSDTTFHILPYIQREKCLKDVLSKIIQEQQILGDGNFSLGALQHSQQFIMKIKFLVFLMQKQNIEETKIFQQMVTQCLERQNRNLQLFQKNKSELLQCLTTLTKAKKILKSQKDSEKHVDFHLKIVKTLDTMQANICITSPSTRPQKQKYIKSAINGIVIQNSHNCSHQQNIQEGLKYHATHAKQAIYAFCELKQVKNAIETGKDIYNIYQSLSHLLDSLKQTSRKHIQMTIEQYSDFEASVFKIVMRQIHEILLQGRQKTIHELQFQRLLKNLSFIKPGKIKITGRDNLAELQQVWEIACRYLRNLNDKTNPNDKIQSLVQMIEVIRISLRKDKKDRLQAKQEIFDKQSIQIVLAYCLIRSRPLKILSNINFIEVFLSKQKLLSRDGGALQRLKDAVRLIQENRLTNFMILEAQNFEQEFLKSQTANKILNIRENEKATSLIGYI